MTKSRGFSSWSSTHSFQVTSPDVDHLISPTRSLHKSWSYPTRWRIPQRPCTLTERRCTLQSAYRGRENKRPAFNFCPAWYICLDLLTLFSKYLVDNRSFQLSYLQQAVGSTSLKQDVRNHNGRSRSLGRPQCSITPLSYLKSPTQICYLLDPTCDVPSAADVLQLKFRILGTAGGGRGWSTWQQTLNHLEAELPGWREMIRRASMLSISL